MKIISSDTIILKYWNLLFVTQNYNVRIMHFLNSIGIIKKYLSLIVNFELFDKIICLASLLD